MKMSRAQTVSFKPFDNGEYIGVLVGFSYIGMHSTKEWGEKPKCMMRWEVHRLDPPHDILIDDEDQIHVVSQSFPATINGDSWLMKCLVAHGIAVPGGSCTDSKDWYAHTAKLKIEGSSGSRGGTFMNVTEITKLDQEVKILPKLLYEHWEPSDETPPPLWAKGAIERSTDLWRLMDGAAKQQQRDSSPQRSEQYRAPYQAPSHGGVPAPVGERRSPIVDDDDQDIPF